MKIIIIGAAGFIGSSLVSHLLQSTTYSIISIDNLSKTPDLDNLQFALAHKNDRHKFYLADVLDRKIFNKILELEKPDVVFNLAQSIEFEQEELELWIHELLRDNGFDGRYFTFNDIKYTDKEKYTHVNIDTCTVFGPRQNSKDSLVKIIKYVMSPQDYAYIWSSKPQEYLYIKDFLEAITLLLNQKVYEKYYYIGSGWSVTEDAISKYLSDVVSRGDGSLTVGAHEISVEASNIRKLGWEPKRQLKSALEHTLQWYNLNKWAFKD